LWSCFTPFAAQPSHSITCSDKYDIARFYTHPLGLFGLFYVLQIDRFGTTKRLTSSDARDIKQDSSRNDAVANGVDAAKRGTSVSNNGARKLPVVHFRLPKNVRMGIEVRDVVPMKRQSGPVDRRS
jgi:hypothetical protein